MTTPTIQKPPQVGVAEPEQQTNLQPPKMHAVFIHNDDYTDAFFVVHILKAHFGKSTRDAFAIMENAHGSDRALVGKYPQDIADTKVAAANAEARSTNFPLLVTSEKDD